jgi:type IV pilus assembly protein PilQ
MRYRNIRLLFPVLLVAAVSLLGAALGSSGTARALEERQFSVNVNGATAENVVRMIAQRAGLEAKIEGDLSKRVSYSFSKTTLENALSRMAGDVGFDYSIRNGVLHVSRVTAGRAPASAGGSTPRLIELKFVDAEEIAQKLRSVLKDGEEIHVDKRLNTLVFMGSDSAFRRSMEFVDLFDRLPQQIMIEAKIVETNDRFSRELGFQAGDLSSPDMNNDSRATGLSTPLVSQDPNFRFKYKLGVMNNRNLDLRLVAAEQKGDAKVISRPRVVTINNTRALINSGLVFNVKTLGQTAAPEGAAPLATGGLERVEAGLQLGVLPTIVDRSMVRLLVDVNNSEPDTSISIDNIPGISTNSANTSIIVDNGSTAVIAGLIKQAKSSGRTGVPFLSDIPVLGLLFRSDVTASRNNELMIFITPRILPSPRDMEKDGELAVLE